MKTHTAVAMALLSMSVLAGLAAVPVQAVTADCSETNEIPNSPQDPPKSLPGGQDVTWWIEVTAAGGDETVRVSLESNNDLMEFAIFEDVNGCDRSAHVNTQECKQQDVELNTTSLIVTPPEFQDCELGAPGSGDRTFYFVLDNLQNDALDYTISTV